MNLLAEILEKLMFDHEVMEDNLEHAKSYIASSKLGNMEENELEYKVIDSASTVLTAVILARFLVFVLAFFKKKVCSAIIFIEIIAVLCHCAIPIAPLAQNRMHLQDLARLLLFQFICYSWHCGLSCALLFGELCLIVFMIEPMMHAEPI